MNVNEDRAGGVLNRPTNHTGGGLREHKRRRGKIQKNPEDQVPLHLSPSSHGVVRDAERLSTALAGWQDLLAAREARQSNATPTLHGPEQQRARATLTWKSPFSSSIASAGCKRKRKSYSNIHFR